MKIKIPLFVIVSLALALYAAAETTFYVALDGNDAWSGSLDVPDAAGSDGPLATLDGARKAVRNHMAAHGRDGRITVLIRGGEYTLDRTVVFSAQDSGSAQGPVTYQAYPDEQPVFTGGKVLKGWKPCTDEPAGLPEAARGKLYTVDIPEDLKGQWQVTTLYDGLTLLPRSRSKQLFVRDRPYVEDMNCQPKEYYVRKFSPDLPPAVFSREIHYAGNDLRPWKNLRDIEIFMKPCHGWLVNMLPLERIDTKEKIAWFTVPPTYHLMPSHPRYHTWSFHRNPYYIENAVEHLDEPGEWVFNSLEGKIYLWPNKPIEECDIRAPYLQEFIRVEGVEDKVAARFIAFEGLTFHHGLRNTFEEGDKCLQHDWEMYDKGNAILRFRHAEDCSVKACEFTSSSGAGVRLDLHCQRITVADNRLSYLGGSGIVLAGYGPGLKDENHHNKVVNNYIHHVGEIYWHSPGIFVSQSGHNLISHNTIHSVGYTGMIVSDCRPDELLLHKPFTHRREWVSTIRLEECLPFIEKAWQAPNPREMSLFEPLLHSRKNRIEYNEIYNVMLLLGDGNGLYFSAQGLDNVVYRNYFHTIKKGAGSFRLDDSTTFTTFEENVSRDCNKWTVIKADVALINNFAINCENYDANTPFFHKGERNVYYSDNPELNPGFKSNASNSSMESARKGGAKLIKDEAGRFLQNGFWTFLKKCSNSIFYSASTELPKNIKIGDDLIIPGRRGDAKYGLIYADPMFDKDAIKHKVFRFKAGSPAEKLGIKPIDLSKVGSSLAQGRQ